MAALFLFTCGQHVSTKNPIYSSSYLDGASQLARAAYTVARETPLARATDSTALLVLAPLPSSRQQAKASSQFALPGVGRILGRALGRALLRRSERRQQDRALDPTQRGPIRAGAGPGGQFRAHLPHGLRFELAMSQAGAGPGACVIVAPAAV